MRIAFQIQGLGRINCLGILLLLLVITSCEQEVKEERKLPGFGFGLEHFKILTDDLEAARAYYKDTLGFSILLKSEEGPYEGSMITDIRFADLSQLQLLSFADSTATISRASFLNPDSEDSEKIWMVTLHSASVDSTRSWLRSQGFSMDSIREVRTIEEEPEGWSYDSGGAELRTLTFNRDVPSYYPSFIEAIHMDYEEFKNEMRTIKSSVRRFATHKNGVVGVSQIRMVTEDLAAERKAFKTMGFRELEASKEFVRFQLHHNQELVIGLPAKKGPAMLKKSNTYPENPEAVRFLVENLDSTLKFFKKILPENAVTIRNNPKRVVISKDHALGVQMEFCQEPEEDRVTVLMPMEGEKLSKDQAAHASDMFAKYCALCHGDNREGYAADNAPSLRSRSLLASSKGSNFLSYTIKYGRAGTAMGGYGMEQGGPMEDIDVNLMLHWLYEEAGVEEPVEISRETVEGDIEKGAAVYSKYCASCHGSEGEGITAPALGNAMLLATATDHFLRYAITEGRDDTPMPAFKDSLSKEEIDGVTAFLRSRASGWDFPSLDTIPIPDPDEYVLNPGNRAPEFALRKNRYVPAEQVYQALQEERKMVVLDARSEVAWRQSHIPGAVPVPYYEEPDDFIRAVPDKETWIVVYCACPHAASERVVTTLRRYGYQNTVIIDEGILMWTQMGYPLNHGN